jgi:hypothetical protein
MTPLILTARHYPTLATHAAATVRRFSGVAMIPMQAG